MFFAACTGAAGGDDGGGGGGDDDEVPAECESPGDPSSRVSTVAGCDASGSVDGSRDDARFNNPVNVIRGPDDLLYVADFDNGMIRVVQDDGTTSTLVDEEGFRRPFALAFVGDTLYVSTDDNDLSEHSDMTGTIWRVNVDTGSAEVVVRNIGRPRGMVALADGRIVMSDYQHHAVRVLDPSSGDLNNLAGAFDQQGYGDMRGNEARFAAPYGMAELPDGRIAIADGLNNRIRVIDLNGDVTTLAGDGNLGDDDGAAASASFAYPQALAVGADGAVYVTDIENFVIRKIHNGQVSTVVGSGSPGWRDSDNLLDAQFYGLEGIWIEGSTMWVADGSRGEAEPYHRIRKVEL